MRAFALTALLGLILSASPLAAQTVEQEGADDEYAMATQRAENVYVNYHKAMEAEMLCNDKSFDQADRLAMERVTADRMTAVSPQVTIGAARLMWFRDKASGDMEDIVDDQGCDDPRVKKYLAFFRQRLAAVAPGEAVPTRASEPRAEPPATVEQGYPQMTVGAAPQGRVISQPLSGSSGAPISSMAGPGPGMPQPLGPMATTQ